MPRRLRLLLVLLLLALPGLWWALSATSGEPPTPAAPQRHAPPVTSAAPSPPPPTTAQAVHEPLEENEEQDEEDTADEEKGTGPCIAVQVTAQGVPVLGAHVAASRREDEHSFYEMEPLELGPDGRGQSWCVPGTYLLAAQAPGFGPALLQIVEPETGTPPLARFELEAGHVVSGRVLDKDSQEPIPGAKVTLSPREGFSMPDADTVLEEQSASSDTHGVFHFEHLAEGTYGLSLEAPGHSLKETLVRVPRMEPLSIELVGTCRLEGEVVTAAGAPVPGATVWVSGPQLADDEKPPRTDERGHFSFEVEAGTYSLGAQADGQVGVYEGDVTVARGGLVDGLVIRLGDAGSLSGTVFLRSSHAPVENATLLVHREGSDWNQPTRTDASGAFHLEHLPPGRYALALLKHGLSQVSREGLSIQAGQELTLELPVELLASIEGSMTDSQGHPAKNASVSATLLEELHP